MQCNALKAWKRTAVIVAQNGEGEAFMMATQLYILFIYTHSSLVLIKRSSESGKERRVNIMGNDDAALKTCLLWLAAIIVAVGLSTRSRPPHKMLVTYLLGVLGIAGVLLLDWDYFNRHFSRWPYPVTADERASLLPRGSPFLRFASSPLKVITYIAIYGYAIYKWWGYVSNDL